ncbi:MAG: hypothetical protein NTX72_03740 [Candidatus Uhrbacteria bacterium]|nr:hypothetical protein [Candidatus Uhrbacteria bacterium]
MKLKKHLKENVLKNLVVILATFAFYPFLKNALDEVNSAQAGNLLMVISMFLVTVCFANFEFTYEKSQMDNKLGKWLATGSTAIFMFLIAIMLEIIVIIIRTVYPSLFGIFFVISALLYLSIVIYDFWDLIQSSSRR